MTWFRKIWSGIFGQPSPAPEPDQLVASNEDVARFVFESNKISKQAGRAKPSAFEPHPFPEKQRLETSVCCKHGATEERIWELGRAIRDPLRAIARCDVSLSHVYAMNLRCVRAVEGYYPEHAVLVDWPGGDTDHAKASRKNICRALAENATVVICPG